MAELVGVINAFGARERLDLCTSTEPPRPATVFLLKCSKLAIPDFQRTANSAHCIWLCDTGSPHSCIITPYFTCLLTFFSRLQSPVLCFTSLGLRSTSTLRFSGPILADDSQSELFHYEDFGLIAPRPPRAHLAVRARAICVGSDRVIDCWPFHYPNSLSSSAVVGHCGERHRQHRRSKR